MSVFQNILALYSMQVGDEAALECAATLARATAARLSIVDVLYTESVSRCLIEERRKHLDRLAESIRHRGVRASTDLLLGRPDHELIRKALRDDHDLVVLADDRRQGLQELLNGSTCVNVMRKCPCPVWIVRPSSTPRIGTVLALVAPPPQTEPGGLDAKVLRCAAEVARGHGATLQVLKAWEVNGPEAEILRAEAPVETRRRIVECHLREHRRAVDELLTLVDLTGIDHEVRLPRGDPRQVIPELTDEHEPDLIVMGSSARATLTDLLFGCTTEVVFARVDCAVLAVKPDGFVSPLALPGY